ncbi:hypothetical protein [Allomuricauda sp.]|uniref:hypothetical protein n=1 Tax=Flagellimonas alginolytica TaxID=3177515 RepID=UPI0025D90E18|nr:hypothetical protein [Allomuricauda sp.]
MLSNDTRFSPAGFIKIMSLLHLGICATPIVLGTLFYFNTENAIFDISSTDDFFLALVPLGAIGSIFFGDLVFKKMTRNLPDSIDLRTKLARFQTASIIKYALLEGAAILGIVVFIHTQNLIYLIIGALVVFYLALLHPTKQKIENSLSLTGEDKAKFDRVNAPLD